MAWLWFALACNSGPAPGAWVPLPEADPVGIEARFRGVEPFSPTAQQAFDARARCPKLSRAKAENGGKMWYVTVEGERLETVTRVGAVLPDGKVADALFERQGEALLVPVACESCEVFFAIDVDGHPLACTGPGRSLKMEKGIPIP